MKILLIDDEPDILHHMKKALQILGHNCDAFEDPLAALAHFNGDHYDLVISDVVMPGMNGFSVAAEVRRIDPATKVILSSGHLTDAMEDTTGDNTSLIYLKKPVDIHRLKTVLDNINRPSRAGDDTGIAGFKSNNWFGHKIPGMRRVP